MSSRVVDPMSLRSALRKKAVDHTTPIRPKSSMLLQPVMESRETLIGASYDSRDTYVWFNHGEWTQEKGTDSVQRPRNCQEPLRALGFKSPPSNMCSGRLRGPRRTECLKLSQSCCM